MSLRTSKTEFLDFKKVLLRYFCKKIQKNMPKNKAQYCKNQNAKHQKRKALIACLHGQNKSSFFGGPAFIKPIKTI